MKIKYSYKEEKNKKAKKFEFETSKDKNELIEILELVCSIIAILPILFQFVVKIVELITNRLFYYCFNNRIFILERNLYESR